MDAKDVTAVPKEVVRDVLDDPWKFLGKAAEAAPGWADAYGGPVGVAQLTSVVLADLSFRAQAVGELRSLAVQQLRTQEKMPLAEIAESLGGVTQQAVWKISARHKEGTIFHRLREPGGWAGKPRARRRKPTDGARGGAGPNPA